MVIKRQESLCVVGGCGAKTRARSLCGKHYQEARSKGWRLPELRKATIEDRLLHGSTEDPATGCWIWSMATGIDWEAAHEALESMDDFARMDVSVAPYGPYAVLLDVLTKAKHMEMRLDRYESPIPYELTESGKAALK